MKNMMQVNNKLLEYLSQFKFIEVKKLTEQKNSLNMEIMEMNENFEEELKIMQENQSNMMFELELQFRKILNKQVYFLSLK